ncbi:hypothetical protein RI367_004165 [Sorochytrium milnesiophthora]
MQPPPPLSLLDHTPLDELAACILRQAVDQLKVTPAYFAAREKAKRAKVFVGNGDGNEDDDCITPQQLKAIEGVRGPVACLAVDGAVPSPALPIPPVLRDNVERYIDDVQRYNYFDDVFFPVHKRHSVRSQTFLARQMMQYALPIKCLEAVVLGLFLTHPVGSLVRIPVAFTSRYVGAIGAVAASSSAGNASLLQNIGLSSPAQFSTSATGETQQMSASSAARREGTAKVKNVYRHIVLALCFRNKWGAIGLSRRATLMYKPLQCKDLTSLLGDYIQSYADVQHKVVKIKVGLPVPHDEYSGSQIVWKYMTIYPTKQSMADDVKPALDAFARDIKLGRSLPTRVEKGAASALPALYKTSSERSTAVESSLPSLAATTAARSRSTLLPSTNSKPSAKTGYGGGGGGGGMVKSKRTKGRVLAKPRRTLPSAQLPTNGSQYNSIVSIASADLD